MAYTRIEFDLIQEMHKITAGEVSAGYFSITYPPDSPTSVRIFVRGGPSQLNKQVVGTTGATPDFDVLNGTQIHINGNGGATGLSGHLKENVVCNVVYDWGIE